MVGILEAEEQLALVDLVDTRESVVGIEESNDIGIAPRRLGISFAACDFLAQSDRVPVAAPARVVLDPFVPLARLEIEPQRRQHQKTCGGDDHEQDRYVHWASSCLVMPPWSRRGRFPFKMPSSRAATHHKHARGAD